jgi:hypothetical protein
MPFTPDPKHAVIEARKAAFQATYDGLSLADKAIIKGDCERLVHGLKAMNPSISFSTTNALEVLGALGVALIEKEIKERNATDRD